MNARLKEGMAALLGVVLLSAWGYYELVIKPDRSQANYAREHKAAKQRFNDWAYVAKERELAPGETIRLVVIPNPLGEFFDTRCLIYTHREFKTSSMICPDADKQNLAESDQ